VHTAQTTARQEIVPSPPHTASLRLRRCDSRNWVVERRTAKGKYAVTGYYGELERAADRIPELKELAEAVRAAKAELSAYAAGDARKAETAVVDTCGEIGVLGAHTALQRRTWWEAASRSWAIQIPTTDKTKNGWRSVSWFPLLEQAARSLFDTLMLEGEE